MLVTYFLTMTNILYIYSEVNVFFFCVYCVIVSCGDCLHCVVTFSQFVGDFNGTHQADRFWPVEGGPDEYDH